MKDKKIIIAAVSIITVLVIAIVFMILSPKSKTYDTNGFKIRAANNFIIKKSSTLTALLDSKEFQIAAIQEKFSDLEDEQITKESSLQEYASRVAKINNINVSSLYKLENTNHIYYTYYKDNYVYITLFAKENNSFWIVYFIGKEENDDVLFEKFKKWGKTIEFK